MYNKLRGYFRLIYFVCGASYYIARYLVKAWVTGPNVDRGIRLRKQFIHQFFPVLGIHVDVRGQLPEGGGLLVCNHRSYVDPFLLLKDVHAMPVGKMEMTKWPVIGKAGMVSGAIFVDRSSPESRKKARTDISNAIKKGYFIINYAEGTTHDGAKTIDFKPGMFREAAEEGYPIYPVALEYQYQSDAWIGDDTFIRHFLECFGKAKTPTKVWYGTAIQGGDTEMLIRQTKEQIDAFLTEMRKDWIISNAATS